jgi:hypothetical protein
VEHTLIQNFRSVMWAAERGSVQDREAGRTHWFWYWWNEGVIRRSIA